MLDEMLTGEILYIVKLPDGSTYAQGAEHYVPGGPLLFEREEHAKEIAEKFKGHVEERSLGYALKRCQELRYALWIKRGNGSLFFVPQSVPKNPNDAGLRDIPSSQ